MNDIVNKLKDSYTGTISNNELVARYLIQEGKKNILEIADALDLTTKQVSTVKQSLDRGVKYELHKDRYGYFSCKRTKKQGHRPKNEMMKFNEFLLENYDRPIKETYQEWLEITEYPISYTVFATARSNITNSVVERERIYKEFGKK